MKTSNPGHAHRRTPGTGQTGGKGNRTVIWMDMELDGWSKPTHMMICRLHWCVAHLTWLSVEKIWGEPVRAASTRWQVEKERNARDLRAKPFRGTRNSGATVYQNHDVAELCLGCGKKSNIICTGRVEWVGRIKQKGADVYKYKKCRTERYRKRKTKHTFLVHKGRIQGPPDWS